MILHDILVPDRNGLLLHCKGALKQYGKGNIPIGSILIARGLGLYWAVAETLAG